jgi:hypothetical protein
LAYGRDNIGAAGVLAVFSGALGLAIAGFIFLGWNRYSTWDHITGVAVLIAGIGSIWGARRFVFKGENYKLAILFGGICSLVSGMLFGLFALILIVLSKKEFEDIPPELSQH